MLSFNPLTYNSSTFLFYFLSISLYISVSLLSSSTSPRPMLATTTTLQQQLSRSAQPEEVPSIKSGLQIRTCLASKNPLSQFAIWDEYCKTFFLKLAKPCLFLFIFFIFTWQIQHKQTRTRGGKTEGADESTEAWWHPFKTFFTLNECIVKFSWI